jgi:hypothetical chaperone protein
LGYCAIDFGTSNSAIASSAGADEASPPVPGGPLVLAPVEAGALTLPTAIFQHAEDGTRAFGRAAIAAYTEGHEGRLLRSLKSILGSRLVDESTHMGDGMVVRYLDLITSFLAHLKTQAERASGAVLDEVMLGRPVRFHDDDDLADAAAEDALARAARAAGFRDVAFQYEPIAAALDYESGLHREELVFVADIGGGTSDFSVIRLGPERARHADRSADVLANAGLHTAGTDFDARIELWGILPLLGYQSTGPTGRTVPHRVYFDLSTWHLVNSLYLPKRIAEIEQMRYFYGEERLHRRLMRALRLRMGHTLLGQAEEAKITVAGGADARIDLGALEEGLWSLLAEDRLLDALGEPIERITRIARRTVEDAGIKPADVDAIYFTGGSTGLGFLTGQLAALFPAARPVFGERFASVATGLGIAALQRFGSPGAGGRPRPRQST